MPTSARDRLNAATSTWGRQLLVLACSVFLAQLGQGAIRAVETNFLVNTLGLTGRQVLWQTGIREIPGLGLVFIALLTAHWPLSRQAAVAVCVMGLGYLLYAWVNSYSALLAAALVASLGFHQWFPVQTSLGLALCEVQRSGRVLGALSSVGSLATILGMALAASLATALPLRAFYIVGGLTMIVGGLLVSRIPGSVGERRGRLPRLLLKRRYWLYYVLTFFEGSRTQVFGAFGTLILVQDYGLATRDISLLLTVSGIVNFLLAPRLGHLLDVAGERITLTLSYLALALCFVGYATVHNAWFLGLMVIGINLLVTLSIGLSSYVNRIAAREDLTPTLTAGVSINHITSVSMSLLAGALLSLVGYERLCWGAAGVILLSVPFALAIRIEAPPAEQALPERA